MIGYKKAFQFSILDRSQISLLISLLAIFAGLLIGWVVANPDLSLPTIILVTGTIFIFLWLLQYARISAFYLEKVCCYLTILTGFFGAALFPFDLGLFTLFPYRMLLVVLWMLYGMRLLSAGGKAILPQRQIQWFLMFLFFWLVYAACSLAWASSVKLAVRQLIFLFMGVSVIFFSTYYFREERDLRRLFFLWFCVFICLLLLGFWEHLTGQHLSVSGFYGEMRARFMFRPTGVFHNPNDYATFLALSIPFSIGLLRYGGNKFLRFFGLGAALGAFYLIVVTDSRANILAVLLELVFLLIFLMDLKQRTKLVAVATVCLAILVFSLPDPVRSFFFEVKENLASIPTQAESEVGSVAVRMNLIRNGLLFVYSTAGFGVGAGNAEYWMANFGRYETAGVLNPHNWWLEILTNYGIFVFVGYIAFYMGIVRGLWRAHRMIEKRTLKMVCEPILVSLVGFFFASISSSSIMAFKPQWLLFAFALAFLNYVRA